jgi:predicted esterase
MLMYRPFKTMLIFLAAAAIVASVCCQNGNCVATEQKLKGEMRMLWSRSDDAFLREWLLCGVFPSAPKSGDEHPRQGYDIDYLGELGGEAAARPVVGQTVKRPDGSVAIWTNYTSDGDIVDFIRAFAGQRNTNTVAYAYTTIDRDEAGRAILALGSDDSVKVWLNGELVHSHAIARAVQKDEDIVSVAFKEGDNSLLIKVDNGTGDWGFVVRVLNEVQALALEAGDIQPRIEDKPDLLIVSTGAGLSIMIPEIVHIEAVAAGGKVLASAEAKRGESVSLETKDWPDGPYEIRVSKRSPEGYRVFRHLPWYKGDWLKQVRELIDECEKLPEDSDEPSALRYRVVRDLILDRIGGDLSAEFEPDQWRGIHSPLMEHRELQLGDAACIRPHGFIRLAWMDEIDDSPQFARAYLPPDYDPAQKWPMVVSLHGYNSDNPEYIRWWSVTDRHNGMTERHDVIVVEPHGRGNTMYSGIGDLDVLRAIQIAKEKFSVDEERVYLMGYSMGGGGTWHVGTRHPELFAAIGPVYGGWDYHIDMEEDELAKLTPLQRFEQEGESSFAQADALLNTPVFINHGDSDDLVDINQSRHAARMLQRWGYNVRYWEHPGKGHGGFECEDELISWFFTHRLNRNPRQVRVRSAYLKSAAAHWVRVEQREDPFAFIHADAWVVDPHTIRLDTENVLQILLTPGDKLVDYRSPIRVIWNGEDTGTHTFSSGAITLQAEGYKPAKRHKTPRIAGPVDDVTTTPFAIVVGTISKDPRMRRFCSLRAEAARNEWQTWQHVEPRFFLDTEITDEQIRKYSLQLFGGPNDNLIVQKLISHIPLEIGSDSITIDGQSFAAKDASVSMVYPHPLNPDRYISIAAGNSPTGMFFSDRVPGSMDFCIMEAIVDGPEVGILPEKARTVAGCFDHNWRYNEKYAMRGDPSVRAKAPIRKAPKYLTAAVEGERLMMSELLETRSSGSFNYMERDLNWSGQPLKLAGKTYDSGIGVEVWHEPCFATYDLTGGDWKRLRATIGIEIDRKPEELEQKEKDGTRVYFVVRGDGEELYRSPTFRWDSAPVDMDVDIAGVQMLELRVANEATWHNAASSVNWADVRLEK